ncbi:MAG: hypothetical protein QW687_00535 [Candidatus Hadarchaeales archaeon]
MPVLEEYVTLEEAQELMRNFPLQALIENGIIKSVKFKGEVLVNKTEVLQMAKSLAEKFAQSEGDKAITQSAAARKYNIKKAIIRRWRLYGWVREVGRGPRRSILISEQDVARLAALAHERGKKPGKRLLPRNV